MEQNIVIISDWNAGNFSTSTITGDVKFETTDISYPLTQNYILTN